MIVHYHFSRLFRHHPIMTLTISLISFVLVVSLTQIKSNPFFVDSDLNLLSNFQLGGKRIERESGIFQPGNNNGGGEEDENYKDNIPPELDLTSSLLDAVKLEFPGGKALHDNKRLLEIYYFMWTATGWESILDSYDICLATQSSLDRIYWLPNILAHWNGPVSLAIHITSEEEFLILNLYVDFLQRCYASFKDQVAIHIAVPSSVGALFLTEDIINEWTWNTTITFQQVKYHNGCKDTKKYMQFLQATFPIRGKEKLALKEVYPQNHMRNIARKGCGTEWTFSTDIDIIPNPGMAESLQEFYDSLKKQPVACKKCAFVIPTFELDELHSYPHTKKEIVKHYESGDARPFHEKIFASGHKATNYKLWSTSNLDEGKVKVSHKITTSQTYLYEPFYVSSDAIPQYDERFLGYGFTRNTQFQEAMYAGWNFTVLTPIYSIHWGLQTHRKLLSTKKGGTGEDVRRQQTAKNGELFKRFLKELKLKQQENLF